MNVMRLCPVCDECYDINTRHDCHPPMRVSTVSGRWPDDVTKGGGVHAHVEGRYDLVPPEAIRAIAVVMEEGVKNGRDASNWRKVTLDVQINHALAHLVAHLMGEEDEDHLAHALTRLAMAVAVRKEGK
jgi:hypothetical protein